MEGWSILYFELKACALPPLERNNKGRKTNVGKHINLKTSRSIILQSYNAYERKTIHPCNFVN